MLGPPGRSLGYAWRVELSGHSFDLETLQEQFPDPRARVTAIASTSSERISKRSLPTTLRYGSTRSFFSHMNGVAQLAAQSHRAVTTSGYIIGPSS